MIRIARRAGGALGAVAVALVATPGTAAATFPAPDGPARPPATIELVPVRVPVPVDDQAAELLQMQIAAVVGAVVGVGITASRRRRSEAVRSAHCGAPDSDSTTTTSAASSDAATPPGVPVPTAPGRVGEGNGTVQTDVIWR